ncbi:MAG: hypothetical protein ACR2QU_01085 [Gammaproteobacteria bacterium]
MQAIAIIVLGWPGAILGTLLIAAGIFLKKSQLSFLGAVIAAGFCLYIAMNPAPFSWIGLLALLCNFLSAVAVWRQATAVAAALAIPFIALEIYLAYAVLTE